MTTNTYSREFFSQQYTLPRVISWFNSRTSVERTIGPTELFYVHVKYGVTDAGTPFVTINATPDVNDGSYTYIGESLFLWVGSRGEGVTADASSFLEVSKLIDMPTLTPKIMMGDAVFAVPGGNYLLAENGDILLSENGDPLIP